MNHHLLLLIPIGILGLIAFIGVLLAIFFPNSDWDKIPEPGPNQDFRDIWGP